MCESVAYFSLRCQICVFTVPFQNIGKGSHGCMFSTRKQFNPHQQEEFLALLSL